MDILELQYEILSRLSSQCGSLNLNDFQLETGESATDIEAAARALWTHEPHAEIARQQAVTAQEQARKAEKDATFSKIVAIVSLAASIIIPLVT